MSVSVAGIPKNRCRTTVAAIGGRLAELPFTGDQVGLFRARPGRPKRTCNSGRRGIRERVFRLSWRPKPRRSVDTSKGKVPISLVGSATAGPLVRSAAIALLRGLLAGMLLGFMMADHASGARP